MNDSLGDRMKERYEDRTRYLLPRRSYTILRLDGVAFHTWTKHLTRPFDSGFARVIDLVAATLCSSIQGAQLAYTQSDEISILLTDFEKPSTESWFNGNLQKTVSVAASIATGTFNSIKWLNIELNHGKLALFDCRAFTIADPVEVENYFIWRQKDCIRNSVSSAAQALFTHSQLQGKGVPKMKDMLLDVGAPWDSYPERFRNGGFISKNAHVTSAPLFTSFDGRLELLRDIPILWAEDQEGGRAR